MMTQSGKLLTLEILSLFCGNLLSWDAPVTDCIDKITLQRCIITVIVNILTMLYNNYHDYKAFYVDLKVKVKYNNTAVHHCWILRLFLFLLQRSLCINIWWVIIINYKVIIKVFIRDCIMTSTYNYIIWVFMSSYLYNCTGLSRSWCIMSTLLTWDV